MDITTIIASMTLDEKISYCVGKDEWFTRELPQQGISSVMVSDGPHGLRCQKGVNDYKSINSSLPATCFPSAVTAASTFNTKLIRDEGKAIGEEAKEAGVAVVLGPGVNIKRNPLCGRNFEYFSEDPLLAGEMGAAWINGVQSVGVGTSLKHFALNSQENARMNSDSICDERTLHEIYLKPFEIAVKKAQPETVMCSYNKINGIHASDHKKLLNDILREQWGFKGLVVTDWGAINDRIEAYKAGCDLIMPGNHTYMHEAVKKAVAEGKLDEKEIDRCVERILRLVENHANVKTEQFDRKKHHRLAKEIACEGAVLLKNDGILPMNTKDAVLIGAMGSNIRYQGAGSSHINPTQLPQLTDLLDIPYLQAIDEKGKLNVGCDIIGNFARKGKIAIVIAGLPDKDDSEGKDRTGMKLPEDYLKMIDVIATANRNTVVVLIGGSAMEVPFAEKIKALLYMGLPGQGGAEAIVELLCGKANPSGRLCESWPIRYEDVISAPYYGEHDAQYREGVYVGYRYYDSAKKEVRFPFGYGLSYSRFEYSNLTIHDGKVECEVSNISDVAGKEVVQLYVSPNNSDYRPVHELKGFVKVELQPHERKTVGFDIEDSFFEVYNKGFRKIGGSYIFEIGRSSRDIQLKGSIYVEGEKYVMGTLKDSFYKNCVGRPKQSEFEELLGRRVKPYREPVSGAYTMDNTTLEMSKDSLLMKIMKAVTINIVKKSFDKNTDPDDAALNMMVVSAINCPLRTVQMNAGGMSDNVAQGLLAMANGHFFKGIGLLLKK